MTDRLTDEEIEEIRGRNKYVTQGELRSKTNVYTDKISLYDDNGQKIAEGMDCFNARFFYHARTDIPRLLDEVERLRGLLQWASIDKMDDEITRLTDQAQRDAGKIEMLIEEVERLREERDHCRSCLSSVTYYLTSDPPDTNAAFAAVQEYQKALEATDE